MTHNLLRAAATALFVTLLVLSPGCGATSGGSTHHSWIRLTRPESADVPQATADFDEVVRIVDAWAARSGLRRETPGEPRRLSWATSAANGNEQAVYFREANPANTDMPVEVLIAFDPDGGGTSLVEVSMGEGFSKEPTPRFSQLHETLSADLRARFGERVVAKIW